MLAKIAGLLASDAKVSRRERALPPYDTIRSRLGERRRESIVRVRGTVREGEPATTLP